MNSDFRQRVLIPIALPFGALVAIVGVAFSLSRVLRSVSPIIAVFVALGVAGYVLFLAFAIERRPRISSRALAVGAALGLLAVIGAGVVSQAAGAYEEVAEEGVAEATGPVEIPPGAPVFAAGQELVFTEAPAELPAGEVELFLRLEGLPHNVVFEGIEGDEPVVEGDAEGVYRGSVELEPGEYTYYCSIAGHRQAGMEGTLTAS